MSSLGKSSFFIHPTDASHGDIGIISKNDCIILLSKSGESIELEDIVRYAQNNRIPVVSFSMNKESFLAKESDLAIVFDDIKDGFLDINAPMISTTTMLVFGDCLCAAIAHSNNFNKDQYRKLHPGGKLGKSMTKISYIMRKDDKIPKININANMHDVIFEITSKMLGMTCIVDDKDMVVGVITDGDLRRIIEKDLNYLQLKIENVMTKDFKHLDQHVFLDEAVNLFIENKITSSIVVNEKLNPIGAVNIHDLLNFTSNKI